MLIIEKRLIFTEKRCTYLANYLLFHVDIVNWMILLLFARYSYFVAFRKEKRKNKMKPKMCITNLKDTRQHSVFLLNIVSISYIRWMNFLDILLNFALHMVSSTSNNRNIHNFFFVFLSCNIVCVVWSNILVAIINSNSI